MIKIWGRKNSVNVQKVLWCCDELGIAYERIDAGGQFGINNTPAYLALNPNGLVPTIEDGNLVLWESNAIVRYLAGKHGLGSLCPEDPAARAQTDRWMDWQLTVLWPELRPVFIELIRKPPEQRDKNVIKAGCEKAGKAVAILDSQLGRRAFIAGSSLTMGDIPLGAAIYRWFALDIERPPFKNVEAWYARLQGRPAYKQHVMQPLS